MPSLIPVRKRNPQLSVPEEQLCKDPFLGQHGFWDCPEPHRHGPLVDGHSRLRILVERVAVYFYHDILKDSIDGTKNRTITFLKAIN